MAGHRVRGARGAAIAAVAMAALTASQAPGAVPARAPVPQREAPVEHGPSDPAQDTERDDPVVTEAGVVGAVGGETDQRRVAVARSHAQEDDPP